MNDRIFLEAALQEAEAAYSVAEVPVGAVIVKDGIIIARAHNLKETQKSVLAHAECLAIEAAQRTLGDWRLVGCTLYSTLEPCPMCAGAILHARLDKVVFGAYDLKWGAAGTIVNLFENPKFNHRCETEYIAFPDSETILKRFFKEQRQR